MVTLPKFLVLDTGPFFDFLLWRFLETKGTKINPPIYKSLLELHHRKAFATMISRASNILTTAGVFAEIHRHANVKLKSTQPRATITEFWEFICGECRRMNLDEDTVKLLDVPIDILKQIGPVDSSLIEIASRKGRDSAVIGDDMGLQDQCAIKGVTYFWARLLSERF